MIDLSDPAFIEGCKALGPFEVQEVVEELIEQKRFSLEVALTCIASIRGEPIFDNVVGPVAKTEPAKPRPRAITAFYRYKTGSIATLRTS